MRIALAIKAVCATNALIHAQVRVDLMRTVGLPITFLSAAVKSRTRVILMPLAVQFQL